MTTDVTTHAVESVKLAADLQPDTAEALRALFESASPLVTPGFHGPLDIDTLVGLTGSYLWFEDPTNVRVISPVAGSTWSVSAGRRRRYPSGRWGSTVAS